MYANSPQSGGNFCSLSGLAGGRRDLYKAQPVIEDDIRLFHSPVFLLPRGGREEGLEPAQPVEDA